MLNAISKFFDTHFGQEDDSEASYESRLQLASAALMIELIRADRQFDQAETDAMLAILKERFDLDQSALDELMILAEEEAREATSLYQFTSLMNEHFDHHEKVLMILNMWEVAYADGRIDRYEEHLIRKVADLLYLSHKDFITSKQQARARADRT
ncbi:MAG: TerB family tellurite resistance protein [Pseudohongiellaceae bacterium]